MAELPMVIPEWSEFYLTDIGIDLRQKAIAEGYHIFFTKAEIGEGRPADPQDIWTINSLVSYAETIPVKKSYAAGKTHHMIVHIDNIDFKREVLARELAMFAYLVDKENKPITAEVVYGYAFTIKGAETIPAGDGQNRIFEIGLSTHVSRSSDVKILYDGSLVYVTRDEYDALQLTELSAADFPAPGIKNHLKVLHTLDNWITPQFGTPVSVPVGAALLTEGGGAVKGVALLESGETADLHIIPETSG